MPAEWIDFRELRRSARIERVLRAYAIELKVKGDRATGLCPLPGHDGERKSASFSVHLTKGLFNCFSCRRGGNAIDLVALLDGLDPQNSADVRRAALKLASICGITSGTKADDPPKASRDATATTVASAASASTVSTAEATTVLVNPPLDFALQKLDASHPYFAQRGIEPSTVQHFGLGFCARGMLAGRIAIPLHDADGRLIGYAGRLVDDVAIDVDHPKYLFPGERLKDGVKRTFAKSRFLYNGHRLTAPLKHLVVVEGFVSVWWLHQHGIPDVVALMGCDCSIEQAELIATLVAADGVVHAMPDGDDAGTRGAAQMLAQIGQHRAIRFHKLGSGRQPTDLSGAELKHFLS